MALALLSQGIVVYIQAVSNLRKAQPVEGASADRPATTILWSMSSRGLLYFASCSRAGQGVACPPARTVMSVAG